MEAWTTHNTRLQHPMRVTAFHRYTNADDSVWTEFYRTDGGYLLRFPELADFEVSADGLEVACYPFPGVDAPTLEHLFVNQVYPLALSRRNRPAFHGAAVHLGRGVAAFLGKLGMGKSTLTASFARRGFQFLTDDGLLVERSGDGYRVLPNHPSIRLWDDSRDALVTADMLAAPPVAYTNKTRVLAAELLPYCDTPQPLRCAYLLTDEPADAIEIKPVQGTTALMGWLQNSFLLDTQDATLLNRHFDWVSQVSNSIPLFSLNYPRRYASLPLVQQAIIDHVKAQGH